MTPSEQPKMRLTTGSTSKKAQEESVPQLDFSIAGSQMFKVGARIDLKAEEELIADEQNVIFENYMTPSHQSHFSLSYKKHITDTGYSRPYNQRENAGFLSIADSVRSPRMTMMDVKVNMASLELEAPFAKKKKPMAIAINSCKTFESVKSLRTIFKKPEKLMNTVVNIKEILVNPDSVRAYQTFDSTPVTRKTFISTSHNMFRIKPHRMHLAMKYKGTMGSNPYEL
jgi:hypothetical protein